MGRNENCKISSALLLPSCPGLPSQDFTAMEKGTAVEKKKCFVSMAVKENERPGYVDTLFLTLSIVNALVL